MAALRKACRLSKDSSSKRLLLEVTGKSESNGFICFSPSSSMAANFASKKCKLERMWKCHIFSREQGQCQIIELHNTAVADCFNLRIVKVVFLIHLVTLPVSTADSNYLTTSCA